MKKEKLTTIDQIVVGTMMMKEEIQKEYILRGKIMNRKVDFQERVHGKGIIVK